MYILGFCTGYCVKKEIHYRGQKFENHCFCVLNTRCQVFVQLRVERQETRMFASPPCHHSNARNQREFF